MNQYHLAGEVAIERKRKEPLKDIKERYKLKQSVKDSKQQLLDMVVDKDT